VGEDRLPEGPAGIGDHLGVLVDGKLNEVRVTVNPIGDELQVALDHRGEHILLLPHDDELPSGRRIGFARGLGVVEEQFSTVRVEAS
jgi:hypothetical protein